MIIVGPAGLPIGYKSSEEGIPALAKMDLDALEVQFGHGITMKDEGAERIGKLARDVGVKLSVHAPYFINFNSKRPDVRKNSIGVLKKTAKIADALGAERVVCHCGSYSKMSSKEATENIADCLRKAVDKIKKERYRVMVGVETMGKTAVWGSLDEVIALTELVDVFPVIDFGHLYARSDGRLNSERDFEDIMEKYDSLRMPFLHAHFACVRYNEKGELGHLPISSKQPDFSLIAPVLKRRMYDMTIICESPLLDRDALVIKEMLAKA